MKRRVVRQKKRNVRKVPKRIPRGKRAKREDRGGSKYDKRKRKEQQ